MKQQKKLEMNQLKKIALFCTLLFISHFVIAQINSDIMKSNDSLSNLDLYLLIGQSNMSGRGVITEKYKEEGNPNVFMLTQENTWVIAKNPLHFDKPKIVGVGPGLSFGIAMANANPSNKIGLIPCAVGGTSIDSWKPGAFDKETNTHPYDDMLLHLQHALKSGKLKGIIWLQGEADSSPEKAALYLQKLKDLIKALRENAGDPDVPFVAGELGRYRDQYQNINKVLKELPGEVSHTAIASSKELNDKGDQTHFDADSQETMGKRMAKKMLHLQKKMHK